MLSDYFSKVQAEKGSFVMRLTSSYNPWVCAAWIENKRSTLLKPVRLSHFIAQHAGRHMDLDVEFERGKGKDRVGPASDSTPERRAGSGSSGNGTHG